MPVPTYNYASPLEPMPDPLSTTMSDDIWRKFELETPFDSIFEFPPHEPSDSEESPIDLYGKNSYTRTCEIRHHDCMWAGLCISKEHNRSLTGWKDTSTYKKVPAGRSLLIPQQRPASPEPQSTKENKHSSNSSQTRNQDCLQSDGGSPRPDTPQTSGESETESECDVPIFKHDQISINDKLSECMSTIAVHASEVTGQMYRVCPTRRKADGSIAPNQYSQGEHYYTANYFANNMETGTRNMLSDHSYHSNQPSTDQLDNLGVETPSDSDVSEEEIDVETCENSTLRSPVTTLHHQPQQHQQKQQKQPQQKQQKQPKAQKRALEEPVYQQAVKYQAYQQQTVEETCIEEPVRRPRGRPPSNGKTVKRATQQETKSTKRGKQNANKRKTKKQMRKEQLALEQQQMGQNQDESTIIDGPPTPESSPSKSSSISRCSSDEEPDLEKRNLHNNMERQRRIDLRLAFDDLRVLLPGISIKERAAKVTILRQAADYCHYLKDATQASAIRLFEEKRRQERLRYRLSWLRRTLASQRPETAEIFQ